MKRTLLKSAMLAMIFAAAVMATSCQKEKGKEENTEKAVSHFNPANLQIEDMNAYLEGFKEKMENTEAKGGNETMGIEEAAWHLSSVANHDFAQVNAPHDTLRFDTLYCHVSVTDGMINLTDMCSLYEEMSNAIIGFKKSLVCENPNFWFIRTTISENGDVTIPLITMFVANDGKYWGNPYWFFGSYDEADSIFALYLDNSITYYADDNAKTTLQYMLTMEASFQITDNAYFTDYGNNTFYYEQYPDLDSPFEFKSRLYASTNIFHNPISYYNMCYAFDSYAGLAWDYATYMGGKVPVCFQIKFWPSDFDKTPSGPQVGNHRLILQYASVVYPNQEPGGGGYN